MVLLVLVEEPQVAAAKIPLLELQVCLDGVFVYFGEDRLKLLFKLDDSTSVAVSSAVLFEPGTVFGGVFPENFFRRLLVGVGAFGSARIGDMFGSRHGKPVGEGCVCCDCKSWEFLL